MPREPASTKIQRWPRIGGVIVVFVIVIVLITQPVLLRFTNPMLKDYERTTIVFNPLRNRAPEQAATTLLAQLKSNSCEKALAFMPGDRRTKQCEVERMNPVMGWRLWDHDKIAPDEVRITFSVGRHDIPFPTYAEIVLHAGTRDWTVVGYRCGC